jgi:hypothetical protein
MWKSTAVLLSLFASTSACAGDDASDDSEGDDAANTDGVSSTGEESGSGGSTGSSTDLLPETEESGEETVDPTAIDATLSGGSSSGESGGGTDCSTVDLAECAGTKGCTAITAAPFVPDRADPESWCMDESVPVACRSEEDNCDALLTYACDEEGNAYEVGSDCIPEPWSICDPPAMGAPDCI